MTSCDKKDNFDISFVLLNTSAIACLLTLYKINQPAREVLWNSHSAISSEILYENINKKLNLLYISSCSLFSWLLFFPEQMTATNFHGCSFQLILYNRFRLFVSHYRVSIIFVSHYRASITLDTDFFKKNINSVCSFFENFTLFEELQLLKELSFYLKIWQACSHRNTFKNYACFFRNIVCMRR